MVRSIESCPIVSLPPKELSQDRRFDTSVATVSVVVDFRRNWRPKKNNGVTILRQCADFRSCPRVGLRSEINDPSEPNSFAIASNDPHRYFGFLHRTRQ